MAPKELPTENTEIMKIPIAPLVAAFLLPGGGHFWQRRWGRGALLLLSIGALFVFGVTMQGRLFQLTLAPLNIVETLGFLSDGCSGFFFIAAKFAGYDPAQMASPIADYGTKFILVAGLLNVLCILDAYDIAIGKKN